MVVVDRDLRVLFANAALSSGLGYSPDATSADQLERAGFQVIRADRSPWPLDERPVQRAAQQGIATRRELMGLVRDGVTRWVRVSAWPLPPGPDGRPQGSVGTYSDVTRRERDRVALVESETHFRLLAENSTDLITRHSADGTCLYASPSAREVLGRDPSELEGLPAYALVHDEDRDRLTAAISSLVESGEVATVRYRARHASGRWVWLETLIRTVRAEGRVLELQSSTRDVTARVESEQRMARLALGDALTGLANRPALLQHLEDLLTSGEPLALLFLDLDRTKVVNDSLGHSAGDELLRTVAGRLAGTCRDGDLVARLGGDEFVVVAAGLDEEGALQLSDRVQRVVSAPVHLSGHELVMTASVGIVAFPGGSEDDRDAEALLSAADLSMYAAKGKGRARAVVWSASTGETAVERLTVEQELRTALESGQITVHYQPQVDLRSGRVLGVEALARWAHPTRGLLPPAAFLDVADDSGLIVGLGRQVLASAARQVAAWRGLRGCEELGLSVNRSTRELLEAGQLEATVRVLEESGLPTQALTLEVLESVLLDDEGSVLEALASYVAAGIRLALDDFGTGSSSLLHLRRVPVASVKIDRAFVVGLGHDRQDEAIVRALFSLTGDLGMSCIAEGVEEPEQRDWLLAQGIGVAQGYLLHRPLPAAAVEALLRRDGGARADG